MMQEDWPSSPPSSEDSVELERLRAAEDQLRTENEHLRETVLELEQIRDTYFELYDLAAVPLFALDQHAVIQNVNSAASCLLQRDRKQLIGNTLYSYAHAEDKARLSRHLLSCQHLNSNVAELKFRLSHENVPVRLSTRWVHSSRGAFILAALLDERESVDAAMEKQRLVEAERKARRECESKDQFIAMLSHELRTPLTPILAECSKLEENPLLDENMRRVFSRIARNAHAEARLVDDLLDATGILRGKLSIDVAPVDLHLLISECVESQEPEARHKGLHIHLSLEATRQWVLGDSLRLRQVFTNLLRNAIKFTPDDGAIHFRSWNSDQQLMVEVEDSGIGFAPESTRSLFRAFEQLNDKPRAGGLGLGLAIAKGLIELHDGEIDAASRGPGQGARFVVELPSIAAPTTPPPPMETPAPAEAPAGVKERLLLVEDHEDTAEILSELLQMSGYRVVVAHSVQSALAEDDSQIDVVISDLGLPDGTGIELIRKLQARRRRPAIALSGFGMENDVRESKEAGFDIHLTKPVTAGRLIAAVQALSLARHGDVAGPH